MDLSVLDKSSKVTPLLVKLYDSQKLHSLAKDNEPLAKAELTTAVAELLEMELSARESELIADVLIGLMRQAERDLRQALAERLSVMDNVPLRLILQMANDDIEVAGSVLSKSMILSDLDLIYIIKSKGADYWQSIAKRPIMTDQMINILVDTGEDGTIETLVKNKKIQLTEYAIDVVADKACEKEFLAKPLLQREEVGIEIARRLYQHVGQTLKEYISEAFDIGESIADLVDDVILEFTDAAESRADQLVPTPNMLNAAERYREKGLLTISLMLGTLRRGQFQSFVAQLARFTGMEAQTIADILVQANGQGLAVICRAFDIPKADFISVYLLTNRVRNDAKMVDLKDMTKAINYFDKIETEIAQDIIQNSLNETLKN